MSTITVLGSGFGALTTIRSLRKAGVTADIAAVLGGRLPDTPFKPELICIVDTLNAGMRVYRSATRNIVGPRSIFFHWLKRFFEGYYLRAFR